MIVFSTHVLPTSEGGVAASCRRWVYAAEELNIRTAWLFTDGRSAQLYKNGMLMQAADGSADQIAEQLSTLLPDASCIFVHYFGLSVDLGYSLSKRMSIPLIINFRGNDAVFESFSPNFSNVHAIDHAEHLIFVADHLKRLVESKFGNLSRKSTVIHNWLTKNELKNCSTQKDHDNRQIIFGATGIWKWKKGLSIILQMLVEHPELIKNFLLFGNTSRITARENSQLKLLYDLGLSEVKAYPYSETGSIYRKADVIVIPSLGEGSPNVLYEAAANGCFILGSDIPGIREILLDTGMGITFEPGNTHDLYLKISSLLENRPGIKKAGISNYDLCAKMATNPWRFFPEAVLKTIRINA